MVLSVAENQEIGHVEQESTDSRCRSRTYQFVGIVGGEHGTVAAAGSKAQPAIPGNPVGSGLCLNRDRFEQGHCQPPELAQ